MLGGHAISASLPSGSTSTSSVGGGPGAAAASATSSRAARADRTDEAAETLLVVRDRHGGVRHFSFEQLQRFPVRRLRTSLPAALGVVGASDWEGAALSDIVKQRSGTVSSIELVALNSYAVKVPVEDLTRFDPVLAYRRDGARIPVRDKGPLILIYPFDRFPAELNRQVYINRTIWQVHEIVLE